VQDFKNLFGLIGFFEKPHGARLNCGGGQGWHLFGRDHDDLDGRQDASNVVCRHEPIDTGQERFNDHDAGRKLFGGSKSTVSCAGFADDVVATVHECCAKPLTVDGLVVNQQNLIAFDLSRHLVSRPSCPWPRRASIAAALFRTAL